MDSFLKHVFVIAGKHTTVHGVHHTVIIQHIFHSINNC